MKSLFRITLVLFLYTISLVDTVRSQIIPPDTTTYWVRNESGVIIPVRRGPDNQLVPGRILIRFRDSATKVDKLLNTYLDWYYDASSKKGKSPIVQSYPNLPANEERGFPKALRSLLLNEKFGIDSSNNIIKSTELKNFLLTNQGKSLQRLTTASPYDTLSVTRTGDTIRCDIHNWMILNFHESVSPLLMSYLLVNLYHDQIDLALPLYNTVKLLKHPGDDSIHYDVCQIGMRSMINVERAWNYEVGHPEVLVGVYDEGFDTRHPDLGDGFGVGKHIRHGAWFSLDGTQMFESSGHGTPTIGIIGALTNRTMESVAGIAGGWGTLHGGDDQIERGMGASLVLLKDPLRGEVGYLAAIFEASARSPITGFGFGVNVINSSVTVQGQGGAATALGLHAAMNYAYENKVVSVVARGNDGKDTLTFPACYEEPWIIAVGGSIPGKLKTPPSDYGNVLDLLAPSGAENGCGQGWTLNWTTKSNGAIDTPVFSFGSFAGNSAAAPNVTGAVALLQSHYFRKAPNLLGLEPEDFGGILKASAWRGDIDRDTSNFESSWRPVSGWGHLDIGKAFEMLDTNVAAFPHSRYQVSHFHFEDSLEYGQWTSQDSSGDRIYFYIPWSRLTTPNKEKYAHRTYLLNHEGGRDIYIGKYRTVTRTVTLDSVWQVTEDAPLFAWGRGGGIHEKSGWSYAQENFQSGYSRVISGAGGDSLHEGIYHSHGRTFTIETVQYDLYAWDKVAGSYSNYIGHFPPDSMLGVNFSVFGRVTGTFSSVEPSKKYGNPDFKYIVSQSEKELRVFPLEEYVNKFTIEVYDILGKLCKSKPISSSTGGVEVISISDLPSGSYICRLVGDNYVSSKHFQIIK